MATPESNIGEHTVLGLDNVPLDLPIAGAGSRALAVFLDYLLVGAIAVVWVIGVVFLSAMVEGLRGGWGFAVGIAGYFVIDWGYFAGMELALGGRTPGKAVLRLRVVSRGGGSPSASALVVRNVFRSIDLLAGLPLIASDPLARRLGDRIAGTLVVHDQRRDGEVTLLRVPSGWGAGEVAVAEALLRRAGDLDGARAKELAGRLLVVIDRTDPGFLAGIDRAADPVAVLRAGLTSRPT